MTPTTTWQWPPVDDRGTSLPALIRLLNVRMRQVAQYLAALAVRQNDATYNPPSLATGTRASFAMSVQGAQLGDFAEAAFTKDLQGITLHPYVSAADLVTVVFKNDTGGTIDLASGTLTVRTRAR